MHTLEKRYIAATSVVVVALTANCQLKELRQEEPIIITLEEPSRSDVQGGALEPFYNISGGLLSSSSAAGYSDRGTVICFITDEVDGVRARGMEVLVRSTGQGVVFRILGYARFERGKLVGVLEGHSKVTWRLIVGPNDNVGIVSKTGQVTAQLRSGSQHVFEPGWFRLCVVQHVPSGDFPEARSGEARPDHVLTH